MPAYALVFMLFTMANVGLPGTSGFVGEFLTLTAAFQANTWVAFGATFGVILSACYALWLYRRVIFGDLIKESLKTIKDMDNREKAMMTPLVVMTILLGVYPSLVLDIIGPSVNNLLDQAGIAAPVAPEAMMNAEAGTPAVEAASHGEAGAHAEPESHSGTETNEAGH
jgi:NADH-quinone oxidoreductase subunit M